MSTDDSELDAELRLLLAEGREIEAVKRYREVTGVGLAEAKEAVDALERGESLPSAEPADSALEAEIVSLLEGGKQIEAIKLYRARTGTDLKEAKDAVDALAADRRIVVPAGSGCFGVVLFTVLVSMLVVANLLAAV